MPCSFRKTAHVPPFPAFDRRRKDAVGEARVSTTTRHLLRLRAESVSRTMLGGDVSFVSATRDERDTRVRGAPRAFSFESCTEQSRNPFKETHRPPRGREKGERNRC